MVGKVHRLSQSQYVQFVYSELVNVNLLRTCEHRTTKTWHTVVDINLTNVVHYEYYEHVTWQIFKNLQYIC